MSILVTSFKDVSHPDKTHQINVIITGEISIGQFRTLVHRAVNLWPDCHPDIKAFADRVIEGKPQQDYHSLEAYKLQPDVKYNHYHKCPSCSKITIIRTKSKESPEHTVKCDNKVTIDNPNFPDKPYIVSCNAMAMFTKMPEIKE